MRIVPFMASFQVLFPFGLCRFLPTCFSEHVSAMMEESEGQAKANKSNRRLELVQWMAAWDRSVLIR